MDSADVGELENDYTIDEMTQNWDVGGMEDDQFISANEYIQLLWKQSSLKVLQQTRVHTAYQECGVLGLFRMFISGSMMSNIRMWTNKNMIEKGLKAANESKFRAYVGLEMAMSILQLNDISSYWRSGMFSGHDDFKHTMSRDDFQNIRANIMLRESGSYNHTEVSTDPLWHSRKLLDHFQKNIACVAVPTGTIALDEASVRTKCRSKARSYLPSKPDKYAIRFYAVVGTKYTYLSSIIDNRSGNTTGETGPEAFTRLFRDLRTPYNNVIVNSNMIDKDSPTALWILQMAQQTKQFPDPSGKRLFFTDNFYTRHTLAEVLKRITDGEARLCGTVKFSNVDATNRHYLTTAIALMKDSTRGDWKLVRAYNKLPDLEKLKRQHAALQKRLPMAKKTPFVAPHDNIADNAGYIVWKDSKIVIFYTNDLAKTPSEPILDMNDEEAISCVHGLCTVHRWTGNEVLHRKEFHVPAIIGAYNKFMNSVDRMDQRRSTNPTQRKEQRLHMSIFTYILDLSALQAYAVQQAISDEAIASFVEFKRSICEAFVLPYRSSRKRPRDTSAMSNHVLESNIGRIEDPHMLTTNIGKTGIHCHLCLMRNEKFKTIYGCIKCKRGFHVNCYSAYHFQGAMRGDAKAIVLMVKQSEKRLVKGLTKKSKFVGDASNIRLSK